MNSMFYRSEFNGGISNWDVSNVKNMESMFYKSRFNGDISKWNVFKVEDMGWMFTNSQFNHDLSGWNNMGRADMEDMFKDCSAKKPWWYVEVAGREERMKEVKRIGILKMKEKIEERIIVKGGDERKKKNKIKL